MSFAKKVYEALPMPIKNLAISALGNMNKRKRYGKYYNEHLAFLRESQWWPHEKLVEYQTKRLKELLIEVYEYVPYYRRILKELGLRANDIQNCNDSLEILKKMPFLEKQTLRSSLPDLINTNPKRKTVGTIHTSGTTGTPLNIPSDTESVQFSFAIWRRFHDWMGLPEKFKQVRFSGRIIINPKRDKPPFWVYNAPSKQLFMSTYHMNDTNLASYVEKLNEFQPDLIDGYPSAIFILSQFIIKNDIRLAFSPKAIATTAETLYDHQRETIQEAFKCKVYDQYASAEGAPFIAQCEHGKYHVNTDSGVIEFLGGTGGDRLYEMIVTSFRALKVPLIKYRIGDYAELENESDYHCKCRRDFPTINRVLGRLDDLVVAANGSVFGMASYKIFKEARFVRRSQVVQETPKSVSILVVKDVGYSAKDEEFIFSKAISVFGKEMSVSIEHVNEIPLGSNGKFKSVVRKFPLSEISKR